MRRPYYLTWNPAVTGQSARLLTRCLGTELSSRRRCENGVDDADERNGQGRERPCGAFPFLVDGFGGPGLSSRRRCENGVDDTDERNG